jgi:protease-4
MRESIVHATLRSFFVALGWILGIAVALFLIALLFGLAETTETTPALTFTESIAPNAAGERKILSKSAPVILKVDIVGNIGDENLTTDMIETLLIESREGTLKNDRVKAILLNINTPGGTVIDADGIYRALKRYKAQFHVPVYAFVDGMCASGGMYVACAADKIYSTNVSLIGSVGVLIPSYFNVVELLSKIGVKTLSISAGKGKDDLNPVRPWNDTEGKDIEQLVDYYYQYFINIVTEARPKISKKDLLEVYGAHVFPATQAAEYGFIDKANSSYSDALTALLSEIGIDDDYYQVIELGHENWLKSLFTTKSAIFTGEIKHSIDYNGISSKLMNQYLYLYKP